MRKVMMMLAAVAAVAGQPTLAAASYCGELRLACEHKDSLGEQGAGNCKTYRETCQRRPSCSQLRYYCLHKDAYGLQGQGYCQAYRTSCR